MLLKALCDNIKLTLVGMAVVMVAMLLLLGSTWVGLHLIDKVQEGYTLWYHFKL